MTGEINVRLRGINYLFGWRYWPESEIDLLYGYSDGKRIDKIPLHLLEGTWQNVLKAQISTRILEGR